MKFCKKCQCETSRYANGHCKPCEKLASKVWVEANKDRKKAAVKAWAAANPDSRKASVKTYRAANKDRVKAVRKAHYEANKEACRIDCHTRRARIYGNGGKLSNGLFDKLFVLQRGKCPVCKTELSNVKPRSPMDHIMALANGGKNEDSNIQLLCQTCNSQKHSKDPIVFMQSKGFLL